MNHASGGAYESTVGLDPTDGVSEGLEFEVEHFVTELSPREHLSLLDVHVVDQGLGLGHLE